MKMRKKVSALLAVMAGTSLLAGGTVNVKAADEPYELYMNFPTFGTAPAEEEMEKVALENDKVQASIGDKTVVKVIAIPKKLINIVVK